MKKLAFMFTIVLGLVVFLCTSGSGNLPAEEKATNSPKSLVQADANERSWKRWWLGNRAPLLFNFQPVIGKMPEEIVEESTDPYVRFKKTTESATGADSVDVKMLLVMLGYAGDFKEISRDMVINELQSRGKVALKELIQIAKGDISVEPLAGMSSRQLRNYAVLALGEIDSPDVYEPLVEVFQKGEQETAFFAAIALGRHGDVKAAEVLTAGAGRNSYLASAACLALGMMKAYDKISLVEEAFKSASSNEERIFTALSLGMFGNSNREEILYEFIKSAPSPTAKAMAYYGLLKELPELSEVPDKFMKDISHEEPIVQIVLLLGAGMIQYRSKLEFVRDLAAKTEDELVRKAAFLCLAMSNSKPGYEFMQELLKKGGEFEKDGNFAISIIKGKLRKKVLEDWTKIKDPGMMKLVPYLLARYMPDDAIAELTRGIKYGAKVDPMIASLACGLVFDVGRPRIIENNLSKDDPNVRAASLMALAVTECDFAVKYFTDTHEFAGVEKEIHSLAMSYMCPSIIHNFFKKNAVMGNPRICIGVASALGGIKAKGVSETLYQYLLHPNPDVRCYAALAMARQGTQDAVDCIVNQTASEVHPYARGNMLLAAGFLLRKFPNNEDLLKLLNDQFGYRSNNDAKAFLGIAWGVSDYSDAFAKISSIITSDKSDIVQAGAYLGSGLCRSPSAVFRLDKGTQEASYATCREFSYYGMGVLKNRDSLVTLQEALKEKDLDAQMAACISFAALRVPESSRILEETAKKASNFEIRRVASMGMILLGDPEGFQHFLNSFKGRGDSGVREMDYGELTEVSNLYVPVGFRIDDYLQDIDTSTEEESEPSK